jgi:hypothetical protein
LAPLSLTAGKNPLQGSKSISEDPKICGISAPWIKFSGRSSSGISGVDNPDGSGIAAQFGNLFFA